MTHTLGSSPVNIPVVMDPGRWVRQEHQRLCPIHVVETLGFCKRTDKPGEISGRYIRGPDRTRPRSSLVILMVSPTTRLNPLIVLLLIILWLLLLDRTNDCSYDGRSTSVSGVDVTCD